MGQGVHNFRLGEAVRGLHLAMMLLPFSFLFATLEASSAVFLLGGIVGAFLAVLVLIPQAGSEMSLRWITVALIAGSLICSKRRDLRWIIPCGALLAAATLGLAGWDRMSLTSGMSIHFNIARVRPDAKLLFFQEDAWSGMTTVASSDGRRVLLRNGHSLGDDGDQSHSRIGFAAIPTLPLESREDALAIGLGSGRLPTALRGLGFTRVEAAEPAAGIVDAARLHFSFPGAVPVLPRDGRDLLRDSLKVYDLIAMEIHNPLLSGQAHLHSREFYSLARSRLKPGGLLQQWIPLEHVSPADAESAVATVRSVFPVVTLYFFGGQALVVAGDREQRITSGGRRAVYEFLLWHFNRQQSRAEEYLRAILQAEVLDASGVDRLAQSGAVVITDWNRRLEVAAPRHALDEAEAATADASLAGLRQYATAR